MNNYTRNSFNRDDDYAELTSEIANRTKVRTKERNKKIIQPKGNKIPYHQAMDNSFRGVSKNLAKGTRQNTKRKNKVNRNICESEVTTEWVRKRLEELGHKCERTGIPFVYKVRHPYKPSIDRIDNNKGYSLDNVQIVLSMYNQAKHWFTDEQVFEFIKQVYENESNNRHRNQRTETKQDMGDSPEDNGNRGGDNPKKSIPNDSNGRIGVQRDNDTYRTQHTSIRYTSDGKIAKVQQGELWSDRYLRSLQTLQP